MFENRLKVLMYIVDIEGEMEQRRIYVREEWMHLSGNKDPIKGKFN